MEQLDRSRGEEMMPEITTILKRPPLDPAKTALIVIDMINWQVSTEGGLMPRMAEAGIDVSYTVNRCEQLVVPNIQRLLAAARGGGLKVVYTRVGCYRPDYSDAIPPFQEQFRAAEARDGEWACEVIEPLAPQEGEPSLIKTGSGAFTTAGLDTQLRNAGIEHVIYTGVITNGCVLLTLASGFDLGYYGYMVSDATATFSQPLQDATEEIVSGFMAKVLSTDDVLELLADAGAAAAAA